MTADLKAADNPTSRLGSIDFVRGLAMVIMALDHTRDFICNVPFEPEDINHTWTFYFLCRWVTHFCAPAFFLLTGVGAYLYGRKRTPVALQKFLIVRGLWLVLLEFTIIGFAWTFHPGWGMFGVICCLGLSMILLAFFVRLPKAVLLTISLLIIATHDLFDRLTPQMFPKMQWLLFLLHRSGGAHLGSFALFVLFPLIPWAAVTLLGYSIGSFFDPRHVKEGSRKTLLIVGFSAIALFALLRATNLYGNPPAGVAHSTPGNWLIEPTLGKTVILFLDVEKYPPSLQYLLMTLGPIFILLAVGGQNFWGRFGQWMQVYGRVPLFYYILHLYVVHLVAAAIAYLSHQPVAWLFHGGFFLNYPDSPYGHGIRFVFFTWIAIVLALYWPCAWFSRVKAAHPDSLLRFL